MRIGFGYDSHAFCPGDHVPLGGVAIPHDHGVSGHTDGDVLLHALCDAMLGATALGDLGHYFKDEDASLKGASSAKLLRHVDQLVKAENYRIHNLDATIVTEAPKLQPHIRAIRQSIADILQIELSQVSVKASTNDKMGWIGKGEGLAAHVVVLLSQ